MYNRERKSVQLQKPNTQVRNNKVPIDIRVSEYQDTKVPKISVVDTRISARP